MIGVQTLESFTAQCGGLKASRRIIDQIPNAVRYQAALRSDKEGYRGKLV